MKKLRIVFSTNNTKHPFWGEEGEPLGGAWYSYLSLAKELARMGHKVISFHNIPELEGKMIDGVWMLRRDKMKELFCNHPVDVYIGEREMPILRKRYNIKVVCYHSHNTPDAEHPERFMGWLKIGSIDKVIFVSNWHRSLAKKLSDEVCYVIPNGTHLYPVEGKKKKNRIIWASNPTRGLTVLANEIFPRVQKILPGIELHVAGGFGIYNYKSNEAFKKNMESYDCLFKNGELKKGMKYYGVLTQRQLSQFYHEGTVLVYPLTNRSETGSIVAVQSMANLTPVIAKPICVFPELMGEERGYKIWDKPNGTMDYNLWARSIVELLASGNEKEYKEMQKSCKKWREAYLWSSIAKKVNDDFQRWCK